MAVITAQQYVIAGCGYPALTLGAQPPCATAKLLELSTMVRSFGQPLALQPLSPPTCIPTGLPFVVLPGQTVVRAL